MSGLETITNPPVKSKSRGSILSSQEWEEVANLQLVDILPY